jgi:hypothetical protein
LEKDNGFEVFFFAQVLKDELLKYEALKLDLEYKILLNCSKSINNTSELFSWLNINFEAVINQVNSINNLFNIAFTKYWGPPGIFADLKGLYYVALSTAKIFKEMILWSVETRSTRVNQDFVLIRNTLSDFVLKSVDKIWDYPDLINTLYSLGQKEYEEKGGTVTVEATLVLEVDPSLMTIFSSEMNRLSSKYQSNR